MPFAEDLAVFFDVDEFAWAATWSGAPAAPVAGIFDAEYQLVALGTPGIEGAAPVFLCAAAAVPGATHGQTLTIDGTVYTIRGVQPDGTGLVLLILQAP